MQRCEPITAVGLSKDRHLPTERSNQRAKIKVESGVLLQNYVLSY